LNITVRQLHMVLPLNNWNEVIARVPAPAIGMLGTLFFAYPCKFVLGRNRNSKFGDFKVIPGQELPEISVNRDLHPDLFLITLVHELAHVVVWYRHPKDVSAHGNEWKQAYRECLSPFVRREIFPEPLLPILKEHLREAPATTKHDTPLYRYFFPAPDQPILRDLKVGDLFELNANRKFRVVKQRRTRFECIDLSNNRLYLVPGDARVVLLKP
jgi:SprT protein